MKLFTKRSGITINISTEAVVRIIFIAVVAYLSLQFIGRISYQLQLVGIAFFLALALNPAVTWLSKRLRLKSRVMATGLAYIAVVVTIGAILYVVIPPLVRQTSSFVRSIPATLDNVSDEDSPVGKFVQRYQLQDEVNKLGDELSGRVSEVPTTVVGVAGRVGSLIIGVITVLILAFMMLVEGPAWLDRMWAMTPKDKRKEYKDVLGKMYKIITSYVNGQVLIAFIAATFALVAMLIAGAVTDSTINAVALSGIVFLLGLIPLIGNTLAAIIVVIIALFSSWSLALILAIYFPLYQQIENATIQPHIQARNNQLTPLLVFTAAIIGAGIGGLLGAFVAIPVAGCIRVLLEHHFGEHFPSQKKLEEETLEQ